LLKKQAWVKASALQHQRKGFDECKKRTKIRFQFQRAVYYFYHQVDAKFVIYDKRLTGIVWPTFGLIRRYIFCAELYTKLASAVA